MPKLIATVRNPAAGDRLVSPGFREALATVGATAVQVNLDDAAVAGALRFGPGEQVTAVVSVWTDGPVDAALGVVREAAAEDLWAYRVTERVRLDPTPVPDGERSDVFAQVAVLRRPDGMSQEDYLAHWMLVHTPIAIRTQNTSAYIQNIVEEPLTPTSPVISAIVEEHFPMEALTDLHAFYGSRGDDAELQRRMAEMMTSVAAFGADQGLDLVPTSRFAWSL